MKANDLSNYRKLSEPFPDAEVANQALHEFFEAFYELRNKHNIRDAYVVVSVPVHYPADEQGDEVEADAFASMHAGNELMREPLTQWAAGFESAAGIERRNRVRSQGEKSKRQTGARN
jgi:hypothetical protein